MNVLKKLFWLIIALGGALYMVIVVGYALLAPFLWLILGKFFHIGTYFQNLIMIPMMIFNHMEENN